MNQQVMVVPTLDCIKILKDGSVQKQYEFDKVFDDNNNGGSIHFTALLPLLETVYYHRKDATLIAYGPKNSGIQSATNR